MNRSFALARRAFVSMVLARLHDRSDHYKPPTTKLDMIVTFTSWLRLLKASDHTSRTKIMTGSGTPSKFDTMLLSCKVFILTKTFRQLDWRDSTALILQNIYREGKTESLAA